MRKVTTVSLAVVAVLAVAMMNLVPTGTPPKPALTFVSGTIDFGARDYADVCPSSETYPFDTHAFRVLFISQLGEIISVNPDSYQQGPGCDDYAIFHAELYPGEYTLDIAPRPIGASGSFSTDCWAVAGFAVTCSSGRLQFDRNGQLLMGSGGLLPLTISIAPDNATHLYLTLGRRSLIV